MLWDLNEGKHLYSLEAGDTINALVFSPNRYWLCAATASAIKIFGESSISEQPRRVPKSLSGPRAGLALVFGPSLDLGADLHSALRFFQQTSSPSRLLSECFKRYSLCPFRSEADCAPSSASSALPSSLPSVDAIPSAQVSPGALTDRPSSRVTPMPSRVSSRLSPNLCQGRLCNEKTQTTDRAG